MRNRDIWQSKDFWTSKLYIVHLLITAHRLIEYLDLLRDGWELVLLQTIELVKAAPSTALDDTDEDAHHRRATMKGENRVRRRSWYHNIVMMSWLGIDINCKSLQRVFDSYQHKYCHKIQNKITDKDDVRNHIPWTLQVCLTYLSSASSQLKTRTWRPRHEASAFTDSVFPVPAK